MVKENENSYAETELPFELCETYWGEMKIAREEAPGVFYVATLPEEEVVCKELFVVTATAVPDIISEEVAGYGKGDKNVLFFEYEIDGSGWELVKYELLRYRVRHNLPLEIEESLYSYASFCIDKYPAYFGGSIPPRNTPWGLTIRYKKVFEGGCFLETDKGIWVLALSYPVWDTCLSDFSKKLGIMCVSDEILGAEEARWLYFKGDTCAPALYELLNTTEYKGILNYITSKESLEARLYADFPQYVIWHNSAEQSELGARSCLCKLFGLEECEEREDLMKRSENFIQYDTVPSKEKLLLLP